MLILLPQLSSILRFFIYKNLRLARSRAYALTVASRGKPPSFWSQVSQVLLAHSSVLYYLARAAFHTTASELVILCLCIHLRPLL